MSSKGGSFSHAWLHIGSDFTIRCSTYDDTTPILSVDAGGSALSITPAGRDATDEAVEFARALLRRVQEFAAEVERMHTAQHPDADSSGDASTTADGKAA